MSSGRIYRKNLQKINGITLLEWGIKKFQRWYPKSIIWVATEDEEAKDIAIYYNCLVYPLSLEDVLDKRDATELLIEWENKLNGICMLSQLTSPFTHKKEIDLALEAIDVHKIIICSAYTTKIFFSNVTEHVLSQDLPDTSVLTGNFIVRKGRPGFTQHKLSPVSLLSCLDIDYEEQLEYARWLASKLHPINDFE